jgi:hypothetical protein
VRPVHTCLHCGTTYLPPEAMLYPTSGVAASPVHCAAPACTAAAEGIRLPPGVLAAIEARAAEPPAARRPRRPARGGRPATPRSARDRLR